VPINARPKDGSQGKGIGNQISAMTVPLFTDLAKPDDRLAAIPGRRRSGSESGASTKLRRNGRLFPYGMAMVRADHEGKCVQAHVQCDDHNVPVRRCPSI
jgi:hypothetical protein